MNTLAIKEFLLEAPKFALGLTLMALIVGSATVLAVVIATLGCVTDALSGEV